MKKFLALIVLALPLASCQTAATAVNDLSKICAAGLPIIQQVQAMPSTNSTVSSLASYAKAGCNLDGTVNAALVVNADQNTPKWLEDVLTALQVVTQLAPVILPAL